MSHQLIQGYFAEIDRLKKFSGTTTEGVISEAFKDLLKAWSRQKNLQFVAQYQFLSNQKTQIRPDGTILHELRVPLGYWEAKDEDDNLDVEIAKKLRRGYPQDNIIFEDSREAVLIQNRQPVMRCSVTDAGELFRLLSLFFSYERQEIADFRKAVRQFQHDMPAVLEALREKIADAYKANKAFVTKAAEFLDHARKTINPAVTDADVREMLIQHILTEEIFAHVFNDSDFHSHNNIAKRLYALEDAFFKGPVKRQTLHSIEPYYATIRSTAALITSHTEKQQFLKVIYENFYKIYDKKKADRLGVVYTPNEIVRFIIKGADWLTNKHFGKRLIDRGVEILDPSAGTGTFICELLEHFRGQPAKMAWKYTNELHANEVAILSYYVANLNIEATYAALAKTYEEFPALCFVDTLDNISGLGIRAGQQLDLLAGMSDENVERVRRQNRAKISVVIGNPPYNASQQNENDNNKNRTYPHIDALIKQTYVKQSSAQLNVNQYDMYTRFFRWASDRLGDDGVIAFITNNSFAKKPNYDGFRKIAAEQFCDIYVIDFKGDARTSGEVRRKEGDNIFENAIKVGIAISFMVRKAKTKEPAAIHYAAVRDYAKLEEKQSFIFGKRLSDIEFEIVKPDAKHNWVGLADNDWDGFPAIASKKSRAAKVEDQARTIFKTYALGVSTNRDEWLYSMDKVDLTEKIKAMISAYSQVPATSTVYPNTLKWSETLKRQLKAGRREVFDPKLLRMTSYRPFVPRWLYQSRLFIDRPSVLETFFPPGKSNAAICFSDVGSRTGTCILAINGPADLHFGAAIDAYQQVAQYRFSKSGECLDNVTDWALRLFEKTYGKAGALHPGREAKGTTGSRRKVDARALSKESIFYGSVSDRAKPPPRAPWRAEAQAVYNPAGGGGPGMRCIECDAAEVSERPERTTQGYRRFRCRACGKQFNERSGGILNRAQYPSDVIALVVFWRLRYKLSLRDLSEMFLIRGIAFSYEAVRDWETKLSPTLIDNLRRRRKGRIGRSWYVDETYIKINGSWHYLYRAIDRFGALVDVRLSEKRDMAAAKAFFRSAKAVTGITPARVTTDGHDSYPRAIRTELAQGVKHRTNQYLNNRIEQDHRGIKGRYGPMRGFKSYESASRFCRCFDELRNHLQACSRRTRNLPTSARRQRFLSRGIIALRIMEAA